MQQLFLELPERQIPSPHILAVSAYFSIAWRGDAVAVFLKNGECLDFPLRSPDAQAIERWVNSQLRDQFLILHWHCFNVNAIRSIAPDNGRVLVKMEGIELPFRIPETRKARAAWLDWTSGEDTDATQPRAAVLA